MVKAGSPLDGTGAVGAVGAVGVVGAGAVGPFRRTLGKTGNPGSHRIRTRFSL